MKTDDQLIAEFTGAKSTGKTNLSGKEVYEFPYSLKDMSGNGRKFTGYLQFSKSWDWFMVAYSKFSALEIQDNACNDKHANHCVAIAEKVLSFDLFGANECLVEAIKWYTNLKPDNK